MRFKSKATLLKFAVLVKVVLLTDKKENLLRFCF